MIPKLFFQIALDGAIGDETFEWTTIPGAMDVSYQRGAPNEFGRMETGESDVNVGDAASELDPGNPASPYYPDVRRMRPMRALIMAGNLIQDGSFESGTWDHWDVAGPLTLYQSTSTSDIFHPALREGWSIYSDGTGEAVLVSKDFIPVDPDKPYTLSGYFRQWQADGVIDPQSYLRLYCYDEDFNNLGAVYPNVAADGVTFVTGGFNPTFADFDVQRYGGTYDGSFVAGTKYVKVNVYAQYTPTSFAAPVGVVVDAIQFIAGTKAEAWDEDQNYVQTHFPLFQHFIERLPRLRSVGSTWTERSVVGADAFASWALAGIKGRLYAGEPTGTRWANVLDDVNWPASRRDLDTGNSSLDPAAFDDNDTTKALEHLLAVAENENGFGFIDADGNARFIQRHTAITETTIVATLADGRSIETGDYPGAIPYTELRPESTEIVNDWSGQREGGTAQVAVNDDSIEAYGPRSAEMTFIVDSDAEVQAALQWRLSQTKDPRERIDAITVKPGADLARWAAVLGLEIGDRVLVVEWPPGYSAPVETEFLIRHLEGRVPASIKASEFTFQLTPAGADAWLILDDATAGALDANKLAY